MRLFKVFQCPECMTMIMVASATKNVKSIFNKKKKWVDGYTFTAKSGELVVTHNKCGKELIEVDYNRLDYSAITELLCAARKLDHNKDCDERRNVKNMIEDMAEVLGENCADNKQVSKILISYMMKNIERYQDAEKIDTYATAFTVNKFFVKAISIDKLQSATQEILSELDSALHIYSPSVLSVDLYDEDGMIYIDVCSSNSYDIYSGPIVSIGDVDIDLLYKELDKRNVGHCI